MYRFTKIIFCLLLLSSLTQKACCYNAWGNRAIDKLSNILPLTAAKALVTVYLGAGLIGFSSFEDCSSEVKLAGCSACGLLIGLVNLADKDSSDEKKSFIKGLAATSLFAIWILIPASVIEWIDSEKTIQANEYKV